MHACTSTHQNVHLQHALIADDKSTVKTYLVTAPIDRPQSPIQETCLLLRRKETAVLRSSFWQVHR